MLQGEGAGQGDGWRVDDDGDLGKAEQREQQGSQILGDIM